MANEVVKFNPAQLPAHLQQAEPSAVTKALMGTAFGKRLSIKGGVFRLIDGGKELGSIEERYLDVVIVNGAAKVGRTYYADAWDPEKAAAPTCWSPDGTLPDASVKTPQSKACATCEQNIKGSGQGESRACRFSQRVALVLANDIEGSVMQLSVPALSLFGKEQGENRPLQMYARYLATNKTSVDQVITRLKFDTTSESAKLFFKAMRFLSEEEYEIVKQQSVTLDAIQAITMTVAAMDGVMAEPKEEAAPAPQAVKGNGKPVAVTPADDEEDAPPPPPKPRGRPRKDATAPVAEPTVRAAPAKVEPLKRASIAQVVADWDDAA